MNKNAIVLLSGGMDSLVTAAIANNNKEKLFFLHVNYGQKTETKEMESFNLIKEYYKPERSLVVNISYLKKIGGSSLVDDNIQIEKANNKQTVPDTYVPFRNAHLISIAVSWAEVINASKIYVGAVEEDSSGYPDCREDFYESFEKTINLGTKDETQIKLVIPIIHKSKSEIIRLGRSLNAPFEYSWSCYKNNQIACGVCDSCQLRLKAFRNAGIEDPLKYKQRKIFIK